MLPHLRDRPLTLKRYPNGVEAQFFYEKNSPSHRPEWVQTARMGDVDYTLAQDRPTLIWLANLADIELHTSLALAPAPRAADDDGLRPRSGAAGRPARVRRGRARPARAVRAARPARARSRPPAPRGCRSTCRSTPRSPTSRPRPFARRVAELLEQRMPELVVSRMTKRLRAGQGARRLEPERRSQDDRHRLLGPGPRAAHRLDAGGLGRGRARSQRRRPDPAHVRHRGGPGVAPPSRGTCSPRSLSAKQAAAAAVGWPP